MRRSKLVFAVGISALAISAACHKKVAVATPPPAPTAIRPSPASTPQQQRPVAAPVAATRPAPAAPAVTRPSVKTLEDFLNQLLDAYFDFDKSDLRNDALRALKTDSDALRTLLKEFPNTRFIVQGNCDERGSAEYNLALGDRRAKVAKEFLTQIGVPEERLSTISYGQERPVCTEHTEDCWQKNRRAHLTASR